MSHWQSLFGRGLRERGFSATLGFISPKVSLKTAKCEKGFARLWTNGSVQIDAPRAGSRPLLFFFPVL